MERIISMLDRLTRLGGAGAALALAALLIMGLAELVMRSVFNTSLDFSVEYTGYLVALIFFWGSGWTLADGGHIRLDFVLVRLSPKASRKLDLLATTLALIAAIFLAYASLDWAMGTLERGTRSFFPSATPLALPQFVFATGAVFLVLGALQRLLQLLSKPAGSDTT